MPNLYITEFAQEGVDAMGRIMPTARQIPLASQKVAYTGTSAQSATLDANTTLVRLNTDGPCSVLFGPNPTAAVTDMRMALDQTEYFCVPANSGLKIAVVTNT